MQGVDLSATIRQVLQMISTWFVQIIAMLKRIYVLPHVNVLTLLVVVAVLGMVISAIFVSFDAGGDDD